jgi:dihydroflavonol-4-reductase
VTGATGFIGSSICRELVSRGYHVRAMHRPTSSLVALQGLSVERVIADILHPDTMRDAFENVEWVFHAAALSAYWRYPEGVSATAIDGTRNVLHSALDAGVTRVVLTSSIAAMGIPIHGELLTEDHSFNLDPKQFPYGYAKRQAEIEAFKVAAQGIEVVIVNPTLVMGPGDLNRIGGSMVIEAARGWDFFWLEGGINTVHIQDVVEGHLAAALRGVPGERYILGGENLSHHETFKILAEVVGRRPPLLKIPKRVVEPAARLIDWLQPVIHLPFNSAQLRMSRHHLYCDLSKSQCDLQLPTPRHFRDAAQAAYDWYRSQGVI